MAAIAESIAGIASDAVTDSQRLYGAPLQFDSLGTVELWMLISTRLDVRLSDSEHYGTMTIIEGVVTPFHDLVPMQATTRQGAFVGPS
jgi:acyl carrier protein